MMMLFDDDIHIRRFSSNVDTSKLIDLVGNILIEFGFTPDLTNDKDFINLDDAYKSGELWVACEKTSGKIIASAAYRNMCGSTTPLTAELRRLYVSKQYRRRGLGGMLLAAMEFRARIAGFHRIILESASVLKAATVLYEATGYKHCTLPCGFEKTERCDVVMEKSLDGPTNDTDLRVVDENGHLFAILPSNIARRFKNEK